MQIRDTFFVVRHNVDHVSGNSRSWIALKVNNRSEPLASSILEARGYETFSPTIPERRQYSDRSKLVNVPVFPGYVLTYWHDRNKAAILSCPAVNYIVSFGGEPARISDETVHSIRQMLANGGRPVRYYRSGEPVRVLHGPLSGIEGKYVRRGPTGSLVVSIDILGRSVGVHIDPDHVGLIHSRSLPVNRC